MNKTLYTMHVCKIASSNFLSEKFSIGRDIRKVIPCPPSSLSYALNA